MPLLVRPCHHHRFRAVLRDAFRLGREVFGAGPGAASSLEQDGFDGGAAIYLVNLDAVGRVVATVRITPTICAPACERLGAPRIVALSGLCAEPRLSREERLRTLLELRAGLGLLFLRHGWTHGLAVGHDRHIQSFVLGGMTVRTLGPPVLLPGDSQLSFAVLVADPDRAESMARSPPLQDPDEAPSLFTRYGDRAVA